MGGIRERVAEMGEKALKIMDDYFDGKTTGSEKVKFADRAISNAIKVEHMNQISKQSDRSFGLRLIPYLKDDSVKKKYIEMTNPDVKGLLLNKPAK